MDRIQNRLEPVEVVVTLGRLPFVPDRLPHADDADACFFHQREVFIGTFRLVVFVVVRSAIENAVWLVLRHADPNFGFAPEWHVGNATIMSTVFCSSPHGGRLFACLQPLLMNT